MSIEKLSTPFNRCVNVFGRMRTALTGLSPDACPTNQELSNADYIEYLREMVRRGIVGDDLGSGFASGVSPDACPTNQELSNADYRECIREMLAEDLKE